jgi:radical SAM protein with 4Fe4S-binding SPASM domain
LGTGDPTFRPLTAPTCVYSVTVDTEGCGEPGHGKSFDEMLNTESPTTLTFDVTYRCNLRCKMCEAWRLDNHPTDKELTADEIIEQCEHYKARFRIKKIRFLGGEPLLRKDLTELIRRASPLAVTEIVTNGTLIDASIARDLVRSRLSEIRFSIDAPPQLNDHMRGKGAFDRASRGIELLQEHKRREDTAYPLIRIQPILSRLNVAHLREMYDYAREKETSFDIRFLEDFFDSLRHTRFEGQSIGVYRAIDPGGLRLNVKERLVVKRELCRIAVADEGRASYRLALRSEAFIKRISETVGRVVYRDCIRSRKTVCIDPWGNLFPCELLYGYRYGNCRSDGPEIWLSGRRRKLRAQIRRGSFPVCRECNRLGYHRGIPALGAAKRFASSLCGRVPYDP